MYIVSFQYALYDRTCLIRLSVHDKLTYMDDFTRHTIILFFIRYLSFLWLTITNNLIIMLILWQVGACIVNEENKIVGIGYNGMPNGCSDDVLPWRREAEDELDTKYPYGELLSGKLICAWFMTAYVSLLFNDINKISCNIVQKMWNSSQYISLLFIFY